MLEARQQNFQESDLQETTKATENIAREPTIKVHTHGLPGELNITLYYLLLNLD